MGSNQFKLEHSLKRYNLINNIDQTYMLIYTIPLNMLKTVCMYVFNILNNRYDKILVDTSHEISAV